MKIQTGDKIIDTNAPARCVHCRGFFANHQTHGSITIKDGRLILSCKRQAAPKKAKALECVDGVLVCNIKKKEAQA